MHGLRALHRYALEDVGHDTLRVRASQPRPQPGWRSRSPVQPPHLDHLPLWQATSNARMLLKSKTRLEQAVADGPGAGLARTFTATTLRAMGTSIGSSAGAPGRGSCTCAGAHACKPRSHARSAIRAAIADMVTASGFAGKAARRARLQIRYFLPTAEGTSSSPKRRAISLNARQPVQ